MSEDTIVMPPPGELNPADMPPPPPKTAEDHIKEFEGAKPLAGMESLGPHIRDGFGRPSGSPANFLELRKVALATENSLGAQPITPEEAAEELEAIKKSLSPTSV